MQLPVPPPAALAATGNVPLAAGCLAVSAQVHGLSNRVAIDVVAPSVTDSLGDVRLAEAIAADEPDLVGLSLYLWNVDRSLHLAREVKRRSPRTRIVIGGPEVSADNHWLQAQGGFDLAVAGEGEEVFVELLEAELSGRPLPGFASFGPPRSATFPLSSYPSPYLQDFVPVEPERSVYVEGARGCRSKCTFCFYPKAASGLRVLNPSQVEALVGGLRDRGAREISFLDPTFNHRPDFEPVLEALIRANPKRAMSFFAEVRPEGLKPNHAAMLARAGFTKLEIGLQSVSAKTLKRVQRGGNPAMVAEAAKLMRAEGIDLLVDLIIGLPGDTADDVARGLDFLEKHDLGDFAQVFALYVLPGTAMRDTALADGLVFEPEPPYRIIRTATMDEATIAETLRSAEKRLGRGIDERLRPHLVAADGTPDVFALDVARATTPERNAAAAPGAQHCALWLGGEDLFAHRAAVLAAIDARHAVDPYATLDVVLVPTQPFPLDLLTAVKARLEAAPPSYSTRNLRHRGGLPRIAVVLAATLEVPTDWVHAVMAEAQVFREQTLAQAATDALRLGDELPGARVLGPVDETSDAFKVLLRDADPECVVFASRAVEAFWQRTVLGYGDAGS